MALEKVYYNKFTSNSGVTYNVGIISLGIRTSSIYGVISLKYTPINYNRRLVIIEIEDSLKTLLTSRDKNNELLAHEILSVKIENELTKQNTKGRRKKLGKESLKRYGGFGNRSR